MLFFSWWSLVYVLFLAVLRISLSFIFYIFSFSLCPVLQTFYHYFFLSYKFIFILSSFLFLIPFTTLSFFFLISFFFLFLIPFNSLLSFFFSFSFILFIFLFLFPLSVLFPIVYIYISPTYILSFLSFMSTISIRSFFTCFFPSLFFSFF